MQRRKIFAYLWLFVIFCVLTVGHALLFRFSFQPQNPYPITRGIAFGSALWSTALVLAMVGRKGWARYVLIAWIAIAMMIFGMVLLMMNKQSVNPLAAANNEAILGLAAYALALVPLGVSRSLRRFLGPRTAGGN